MISNLRTGQMELNDLVPDYVKEIIRDRLIVGVV
jgi:hypothetical protein